MKLEAASHSVNTAQVYHYGFTDHRCMWATFTVCDATGELSIQSDAGNYAYRWHVNAIPHGTLHNFIAAQPGVESDYFMRKFTSRFDYREDKGCVDTLATERVIKQLIIERLKEEGLKWAGAARNLWGLCEDCTECLDNGVTLWVNDMPSDLHKFLGYEPWEYVQYEAHSQNIFVADVLLPFFFEEMRKKGYGKR